MTKSDAIRSILGAAAQPLTLDELLPRMERKLKMMVSRHKLYTLLSVMQVDGEIVSQGRKEARTYALKNDVPRGTKDVIA